MWEMLIPASAIVILGIVAWAVASSNAAMVKTLAEGRGKDNELIALMASELEKRDQATIDVLRESYQIQGTLNQELLVAKSLRTHGLLPMMQDPESRIRLEVETVMKNLGCSWQEACDFLLLEVRRATDAVVEGS